MQVRCNRCHEYSIVAAIIAASFAGVAIMFWWTWWTLVPTLPAVYFVRVAVKHAIWARRGHGTFIGADLAAARPDAAAGAVKPRYMAAAERVAASHGTTAEAILAVDKANLLALDPFDPYRPAFEPTPLFDAIASSGSAPEASYDQAAGSSPDLGSSGGGGESGGGGADGSW